ncbi:hypothetical protein [Cellulomonas sp. HZM]|uniref:hypothetical protein n=1 Tax=Cellulomonas sp. HZM TaxID=1454010 RepID=UPI000492F71A|nr:hypothetical protein [Cellulomonas sp. HZM]
MRSRDTRTLAERALVRLAVALGPHAGSIIVIGGLNPELLAPMPNARHHGTADIDLVIEVGLPYERDEMDFSWLEAGLLRAGFEPGPADRAWRWRTTVDGVPVFVDILTDTPDSRGQQIALPGSQLLTAINLSGPAPAWHEPVARVLAIDALDAGPDWPSTVTVRFASLGGYLLAKSAAMLGRTEPRDSYDLAFVVMHNAEGGPVTAAEAAFRALPQRRESEFVGDFRAALGRLVDPDGPDVRAYAAQRLQDGESLPADVLAAEVAIAARSCLDSFDALVRPDRS